VGSILGAQKTAAKKCGCTVEEWLARRANGERFCSGCRQWWFIENMSPSSARPDGIGSSCRACTADWFQGRREADRLARAS